MGIFYTTRESVKGALDSAETARNNAQVDRAIESASRTVEGTLRRKFFPQTATRFFDWPNDQRARAWRLWLDADELISVTTLKSGGTTIPAANFFLEPVNSGPPFTHIEINLDSTSAFKSGDTHQRAIEIVGVFGHSADEAPAGALEAAVSTTTATTVDVTDSALIGVGDIIKIGSERMIVTGKAMLDTTQNIGANLTAQANDVTVAVTTGTAYHVDEIILVGSERMLIVDIAGNNLTVKRAWDGSALAAHTAPVDIFAPRRLTVTRGALGTTAATHADAAAIVKHVVPGLVRELCVAEALNTLQQEASSYGRTIGSGENEREAGGRGLADIRREAIASFGRKARARAV